MEIHANLKNLKAKLIIILCLWQSTISAQILFTDTLELSNEITAFSQDRNGNFFLAFKGGTITKYSDSQDSLLSFSPSKLGDVTNIEAWHGFKIFAFYQEFQDYTIFDRYLSRAVRTPLSQSSINYIEVSTYSRDQKIWAVEENALRLLKINVILREIEIDIPLEFILSNEDYNFCFIKEYQNLVFLIDKISGIYIFDNLGNYLRKIDAPGISHCNFKNDELYFIQDNNLHIVGLYKNEEQIIELPIAEYTGVIVTKNTLILVTKNKLYGLLLK